MVPIRSASSSTCCGWTPSCGKTCALARASRRGARGRGTRRGRARSARSRSTRGDTRAGSSSRVASPRSLPASAALRDPAVGSREGASRRRVADAPRSQRAGPGTAPAGAGRRRTAGPWGTGLHRCIVGATTKERDGGRSGRREPGDVLRPADVRPRRRGLRRRARRRPRRREHRRRPGGRRRTSRSSPTTPPAPPSRWPSTCASWGSRPTPSDVVTSSQAAARLLRDRARRRGARSRCWARDGLVGGAARGRAGAGRGRRRRGGRDRLGLRARGPLADDHARGRADPQRPALGGDQHRPDAAHRRRARARARRCWCAMISDFAGVDAGGGRQAASGRCSTRPCAGSAATRPLMVGDRLDTDIAGAPPGRARLAAGDDRRDRAGRPGGARRPDAAADLDRARPDGARPAGLRGDPRRRTARRAAAGRRGSEDGAARRRRRRRRPRRLVDGRSPRPAGPTSTRPGRRPTSSGLTAPGRTRRRRGSLGHDRAAVAVEDRRAGAEVRARRATGVPSRRPGARAVDDGWTTRRLDEHAPSSSEHLRAFERAHDALPAPSPRRRCRASRPDRGAASPAARRRAGPPRPGPVARPRRRADRRRAGSRSPGRAATKPATGVTTDVALVVAADPAIAGGADYVSRGGHKLAGALAAFEPRGLVVAGPPLPRRGRLDRRLHRRAAPARGAARWSRSTSATASSPGGSSRTTRVAVHDRTNVRDLDPASSSAGRSTWSSATCRSSR